MIIAPWMAMIQSAQLFGHYHEGYAFMLISLMIALIFVEKSTILLF